MIYKYLFVSGFNKDLEAKINNLGSGGWKLHSIKMGDSFWNAVMEKAEEDDGTKRKIDNFCHSDRDGDCLWTECPQEANNRANYQKICPLYKDDPEY